MRFLLLAGVLSLASYGLLVHPQSPASDAAPGAASPGGVTFEASGRPAPLAPRRLREGSFVDVRTQRYAVEGGTEEEILASLRAGGNRTEGETFFGLTVSESSFQLQPRRQSGGCVAEGVQIETSITIHLPEWDAPSSASSELRRDWTRFSTALERHEDHHREIAERGAQRTYESIRGLRRPTCEGVEFEARTRSVRIANETTAEHDRYDDQTEHGASQGAQWPVR